MHKDNWRIKDDFRCAWFTSRYLNVRYRYYSHNAIWNLDIYWETSQSVVSWSALFWKFFVSGAAFDLEIRFQRLIHWFILKGSVPGAVRNISRDFSHCEGSLWLEKFLIDGIRVCELGSSSFNQRFRNERFSLTLAHKENI